MHIKHVGNLSWHPKYGTDNLAPGGGKFITEEILAYAMRKAREMGVCGPWPVLTWGNKHGVAPKVVERGHVRRPAAFVKVFSKRVGLALADAGEPRRIVQDELERRRGPGCLGYGWHLPKKGGELRVLQRARQRRA